MIESGIPNEISKYLMDLNKSIVKLGKEDLLDESDNRKVIYNNDGSLNPNFDKDEMKKINQNPDKEIDKLIKEGYIETRLRGVPQGAPTSCGLSTLNLKELFKNYKDNLIMYADDGIVFPQTCDEDPKISVKEAGIEQSLEKSF
jgi:hypothetical protein